MSLPNIRPSLYSGPSRVHNPADMRRTSTLVACLVSLFAALVAVRAEAQILLSDRNGDGEIEIVAFGDSITYGVGDGIAPGTYVEQITDSGAPRGYPLRLSEALGVSVLNAGIPGEELVTEGIFRIPELVVGSTADAIIIKEGVNDAVHLVDAASISTAYQTAINVARAEGKGVMIATIAPPTQLHASLAPFTDSYSQSIRELAVLNSLPLADIQAAFVTACPLLSICSYYNLPEGLHPNTLGYDAISEVMLQSLAGGN
jgi:lysophospholipase L1-like esterase